MIIFRDMDELVIKIKVAVAFIFMAASFVLYLLIYCESIRLSKADRKKAPAPVVPSGADATEKP